MKKAVVSQFTDLENPLEIKSVSILLYDAMINCDKYFLNVGRNSATSRNRDTG